MYRVSVAGTADWAGSYVLLLVMVVVSSLGCTAMGALSWLVGFNKPLTAVLEGSLRSVTVVVGFAWTRRVHLVKVP